MAVEPNPFFEPSFVIPAAAALGATGVHLLFHDRGGDWTGCLPVQVTRALGKPISISTWRHPYSFLGTPLVNRDHVEEFAVAFASSINSGEHGRFAMLRRSSEGVVLQAIRTAMREAGRTRVIFERAYERATLDRRPEADYLGGLKPRRRREFHRQRRRLGEELGEEIVVHDRSDNPTGAEDFLRLEASGWKGRNGTAMASTEGAAEMLRAIYAEFAKNDRLQLLSLEAGRRTIAMKLNINAADTLFCFKIAFDERLSNYSPGVQLEIDNVEIFHEHRAERKMDSCAESNNEMINRLWPDRRSIITLMFGPPGPTGWMTSQALNLAYEIRTRRNS